MKCKHITIISIIIVCEKLEHRPAPEELGVITGAQGTDKEWLLAKDFVSTPEIEGFWDCAGMGLYSQIFWDYAGMKLYNQGELKRFDRYYLY